MKRRQLISTTAIAGLLSIMNLSHAQSMDNAKIVTGFAVGGTVDTTARRVANHMTGKYAKAVIVDTKPGAGGQIAISAVKAAAPDGTTLLVTPMSMLGIYPNTYKSLPYDPVNDVTPVSMGVQFDMAFAVGPMVPATVTNIAQFIEWSKANPTKANFGSPAPGSVPHFVGEMIGRAGKIDLKHVGYRGTQPAILDLIGGQIAAVSGPVGEFLQHVAGGKVRFLATSGATRNKFAPTVPTLVEQGYSDLVFSEWFGIFLPGKASADVVSKANAGVRAALASKDVIDGLAAMGLEAKATSPEELAALLKADTQKWAPVIKTIGFRADS